MPPSSFCHCPMTTKSLSPSSHQSAIPSVTLRRYCGPVTGLWWPCLVVTFGSCAPAPRIVFGREWRPCVSVVSTVRPPSADSSKSRMMDLEDEVALQTAASLCWGSWWAGCAPAVGLFGLVIALGGCGFWLLEAAAEENRQKAARDELQLVKDLLGNNETLFALLQKHASALRPDTYETHWTFPSSCMFAFTACVGQLPCHFRAYSVLV